MKKARPVDVFRLTLLVALTGCTSVSDRQQTVPPTSSPTVSTSSSEKVLEGTSSPTQQTRQVQGLRVQELSTREELGQTIIDIKFATPISQYRHFPIPQPPHIVLDIFGDGRPATDVETYIVASNLVGALRLSHGEGYLRLNIDTMPSSVPAYVVTPEGGGLKIVVGVPDPKATAKRELILVRGGRRVDVGNAAVKASSDAKGQVPIKDEMSVEAKKYTGQKLSLDFKDADIKNVFRLLADVSGLNIVVTNDVARKVTLRLVEVPWDQALDLLIDTNGLGKEQIGNVVRISTANQLKAERDQLAAAKKAEENLEPLQTVYFNINYAKVKDLEPKVKTLLTKRPDASLVVDERSNTIMVRDVRKVVDDVSVLVTRLDARTPQVLIESNLIETTPTFARALGNRLTFQIGGTTFSSAAGAVPPFLGNTAAFPNVPTGLGATISVIQNRIGGFRNLANALEAAEAEGNIRIISRPSVVTLNNVASTIRSERILRILLPTSTNIASGTGASAAGSAVATERVPVGVILTVTPQVSSDGYVLMNINVKSSTLGTQSEGSVIPDELNREAISNVLVRDGETIVLGGILKDTSQESENGVPYLKDIPILGWLFKSHRWQKDFEELMVFITPRIASGGSENLPDAEQLWREQMKKTEGSKAGYRSINP
ncbi:MAG TPA: type IV pilus secretin PilQ [Candidatus Binatia bacterium]